MMALLDFAQVITPIIVFFGLYLGAVLAYTAKEELEEGRPYFKIAKIMLFMGIMGLFAYFNLGTLNIIVSAVCIAGYLILFRNRYHDIMAYIIFGALFLFEGQQNLTIPSMMLIYGTIQGTLFTGDMFKDRAVKRNPYNIILKIFVRYFWFLAISIAAYFI